VVLKPSEESPLRVLRLGPLAVEAGLPVGVLNMLPGFGHKAGQGIERHHDMGTIVFTG